MVDYTDLLERISRLSSRASSAADDGPLLSEIEDVLAEGYVQALSGEARSRRLRERLDDLVERLDEPDAAIEARRLALQRRTLDGRTQDLRNQLALIRDHFVRLGGHAHAPRP
jgi:hypothetical protein